MLTILVSCSNGASTANQKSLFIYLIYLKFGVMNFFSDIFNTAENIRINTNIFETNIINLAF